MKTKKICLCTELLLTLFLAVLLLRVSVNHTVQAISTAKPVQLAIVIDDFGNNSSGTDEMLALPIKFTGAVMPELEYTKTDQERLLNNGKAVILHQPMEAHTGQRSWLGKTPILSSMTTDEAVDTFKGNLESVSKATGFNNHMGSKITEDKEKMTAVLNEAKSRNLYFLDSLTTSKSVGEETARELGVPYVKRDVFLDSTQDIKTIENNLLKAAEIAKENGSAVAIGHVGAEGGKATAQAISNLYKQLEGEGIEFVTLDELIASKKQPSDAEQK